MISGGDARSGGAACTSMRQEFSVTFAEASEREMKEGESLRGSAHPFILASPPHFHPCDMKMNLSLAFLVPAAKNLQMVFAC